MYRFLHHGGERHEHEKSLPDLFSKINEEGGEIMFIEHAASDGPYDRMMLSTLIVYRVPDDTD